MSPGKVLKQSGDQLHIPLFLAHILRKIDCHDLTKEICVYSM